MRAVSVLCAAAAASTPKPRDGPGHMELGDVVCRPGNLSAGECRVDGTGCAGTPVEFAAHPLTVSSWAGDGGADLKQTKVGTLSSYALPGAFDTWQMYLHGPMLRPGERAAGAKTVPPLYGFGTWTNDIYRWDNFTRTAGGLSATQRKVGAALAPSTGFPIEGEPEGRMKGLIVAGGQPFYFSDDKHAAMGSLYKGDVMYIPSTDQTSPDVNCTHLFPTAAMHKEFGQVVNTVDCHRGTGVCFFTVWKFYDDQSPIWNPWTEMVADDCLYYCITEPGSLESGTPGCAKTGIVYDEHGVHVCHKKGVGAVHGMTVGLTDKSDPTVFDILLVFTGKATFTDGESSMKKLKVQLQHPSGIGMPEFKVLQSQPFAEELFLGVTRAKGGDVGGDHAWVDDTGKYVWISSFRESAAGVHMVDYETGKLLYSVEGVTDYLPNQYAYSAGIHGVGTLGQPGSYIALATSACHSAAVCAPTPWIKEVPKDLWARGIMFVLDLASLVHDAAAVLV